MRVEPPSRYAVVRPGRFPRWPISHTPYAICPRGTIPGPVCVMCRSELDRGVERRFAPGPHLPSAWPHELAHLARGDQDDSPDHRHDQVGETPYPARASIRGITNLLNTLRKRAEDRLICQVVDASTDARGDQEESEQPEGCSHAGDAKDQPTCSCIRSPGAAAARPRSPLVLRSAPTEVSDRLTEVPTAPTQRPSGGRPAVTLRRDMTDSISLIAAAHAPRWAVDTVLFLFAVGVGRAPRAVDRREPGPRRPVVVLRPRAGRRRARLRRGVAAPPLAGRCLALVASSVGRTALVAGRDAVAPVHRGGAPAAETSGRLGCSAC